MIDLSVVVPEEREMQVSNATTIGMNALTPCKDDDSTEVCSTPINQIQFDGGPCLVKDTAHLLAFLRHIKMHNTGLIFYNCDHTIKFLLRNDADIEEDTMLGSELCIIHYPDDPKDDIVRQVLKLEVDVEEDENGDAIFHSFCFEENDHEGLLNMANQLNKIYRMTICRCRNYFIKCELNKPVPPAYGMPLPRDPQICLYCLLSSTKEDISPHFCCVCQDVSAKMHAIKQSCCAQYIHKVCLDNWFESSGNYTCPLCRK